jgi:tRNA-splicing ligase RtcB
MDQNIASQMGIDQIGQVMLLIHCGSRGLGHQVATDYIKKMGDVMVRYGIELPDRQLACAPINSSEGQDYLEAMRCAANYAWANRQCIMHWVRETFCRVLRKCKEEAGLELVYDVAHNVAKIEEHTVDGRKEWCVSPQGLTRLFGRSSGLPEKYAQIGQPVLIPGDMKDLMYCGHGTSYAGNLWLFLSWGGAECRAGQP